MIGHLHPDEKAEPMHSAKAATSLSPARLGGVSLVGDLPINLGKGTPVILSERNRQALLGVLETVKHQADAAGWKPFVPFAKRK
jgi:hypothetical protein